MAKVQQPLSTVFPPPDSGGAEAAALAQLLRSLEYNENEIVPPLETPEILEAEAEELGKSFRAYIPHAWPLVEPNPFINGWHIDAIADHLEAVSKGYIKDLLITMPPRHSKSLLIVVLWPTWEWGPAKLPFYRWLFNSYAFDLSVRDSIKRRKIFKSIWFQRRWGILRPDGEPVFSMLPAQDSKTRYENDKHGFMLASSVGGMNTGEGGERIVADDPHNVKKAESEVVRKETVDWWNVTMSTRRNDTKRSARIVVQQRTHEGDVAGDIIEKGGYVHLNLPTEFNFSGTTRCFTHWTIKETGEERVWADPRIEDGELLNPERFDAAANESAKIDLGDYQYAAQHGQNPTPPKGQIIQAQWFKFYGNEAKGQPPIPDWTKSTHPLCPLLSLDCTFKEHSDTDFVAGLGWSMFGADIYLMPLRIHERLSFTSTIDRVAEFCGGQNLDKTKTYEGIYPFLKIKLVEDKANGPAVIDTLRHRIPGMLAFEPGNASKESRLISCSWRFRAGNIYLPDESIAPWINEYIYELCAFPKAKRDDYVDSTSQALLQIGGDAQVIGEPVVPQQTSRWMSLQAEDLAASSGSRWGSFGGGRSIWRH